MSRCIQKPIELVLQSDEFRFVGRDSIWTGYSTDQSFKKTKPGKAEPYKLSSSGRLFREDEIRKEREQELKLYRTYPKEIQEKLQNFLPEIPKESIQNITILHINENGFYAIDEGPEKWSNRMYLAIPLGFSTEDATNSLIKKYSFCDFPHGADLTDIRSHSEDDPYLEKFTPHKGVRAINWLHMYRRILDISNTIQNIKKPTKNLRDFLLKEIRSNVMEIQISMDDFAYREIRDFDDYEGKGIGNEHDDEKWFIPPPLEEKEWKNSVDGYRVFGHVALCYLEIFTDLERGHIERFCKNTPCQKPLPYGIHGNKNTCGSDCVRQLRNEQKRVERMKKSEK